MWRRCATLHRKTLDLDETKKCFVLFLSINSASSVFVSVCVCDSVHVTVGQKQRLAMLFQSVVLPCQYQTSSIQSPVVQWWYKSYCQDRTQESFTLTASQAKQASHLECADSRRTVRVVASLQGASTTLADHYKGRDIAIINSNVIVPL